MYSIVFNKINLDKNEIERLLAFNISKTEVQAYDVFNKIENHYEANRGNPEVIIDLITNDWTILHDYSITYEYAKELAHSMGWDINTGEICS